ncbi:condensation domain-containing protein, partial [Staphylococcus caprae]|uniref:condensation domain-containing protein n=1 Tax=Staphylococcus caprae TaxID=29380 RepID=UPI003B21DD68
DETVDINRTVGWFTTMYPVGFELKNDFVEMLKEVKLRLRAVPHKGFEYGLVKNGNSEIIEPDISFNYLGKFEDSKIKRNLFSVLSNSKNISENNGTIKKIDFISSVNNNKMIIKFQSIIRFEIVFLKNTLLNSYYVDKKNKYIPSDFEMSGLSSDDLDNLLDEL